jgi:hypothetical protein
VSAAPARPDLVGTVVAFDAQVGLGEVEVEVESSSGGERPAVRYGFHCIEIGASVAFELIPKFGRWEAARIRRA